MRLERGQATIREEILLLFCVPESTGKLVKTQLAGVHPRPPALVKQRLGVAFWKPLYLSKVSEQE